MTNPENGDDRPTNWADVVRAIVTCLFVLALAIVCIYGNDIIDLIKGK